MMGVDKKINIISVKLGENKTLFVPLDADDETSSTAIGFFVKNEGEFTGPIYTDTVKERIAETTPVVAFMFKTKKSINDLIKFLRFYRDNIYKKRYSENNEVEL